MIIFFENIYTRLPIYTNLAKHQKVPQYYKMTEGPSKKNVVAIFHFAIGILIVLQAIIFESYLNWKPIRQIRYDFSHWNIYNLFNSTWWWKIELKGYELLISDNPNNSIKGDVNIY